MRLWCATGNPGKLREFRLAAAARPDIDLELLPGFKSLPPAVEDGATFEENAVRKALHYARYGEGLLFADDSGLEVDALGGAPGVHSARFAGSADGSSASSTENSPDADNNAKLLRLLKEVPLEKRTARFRCVIAVVPVPRGKVESASPICFADEFEPQLFHGTCEGKILFAPRGKNGFGYDPLFGPDGFTQTFAELGDDVKNKLSHRAKALAKLRGFFIE